jgi:hypothetical protein
VILWAIAYTLNAKGLPRREPYIFAHTVSKTRRQAWEAWGPPGDDPGLYRRLRRLWGAKAIKVRIEVVP